jgi:hypothetical protein
MMTIPLPPLCLTLLPPWPQAILYAGKRLENRSAGVAKTLAEWRYGLGLENVPIIGLSQSKTWDDHGALAALRSMPDGWYDDFDAKWAQFRHWAGKLVLCAELLDVLPPDKCEGDPWHVPGQCGLILGRVWEVKPVPSRGGQGAWRSQWCPACKKIIADTHGLVCKRCLSTLVSGPDCPQLEIVTEVVA